MQSHNERQSNLKQSEEIARPVFCRAADLSGCVTGLPAQLQGIIEAILFEESVSKKGLEAALGDIGWKARADYMCISIVSQEKTPDAKTLLRISETVCEKLPNTLGITYEGTVTFVCNLNRQNWNVPRLVQRISEYAHVNTSSQQIGVSTPFDNFEDLISHRKNSIRAVALGALSHNGEWVHYFDELFLDYLAIDCVQVNAMRPTIPHELYLLRKYDEDNGTDLLRFMRVYLENERSITYTARDLGIHKNTVVNRVSKVEEESKIDFGNPQTRLRILLGYALMDRLGI